jgi:hypothetical protein
MDYTIRKVEVDLIALEGHLASLDAMRAELGEHKVTQGLALECDALMHANRGHGSLISLRYNHNATSRDYTVALEGIISTVWEHIKMIFAKIVEYVKKFWAWITGKSNQNTTQKAEQAEQSASAFDEAWQRFMDGIDQAVEKTGDAVRDAANATAAKVKEAGSAVGDTVRQASQATSTAVHKAGDAVNAVKDKALNMEGKVVRALRGEGTGKEEASVGPEEENVFDKKMRNLPGATEVVRHNGDGTVDNLKPMTADKHFKITRREGATDPRSEFHKNQINRTIEDVREQSAKVDDALKDHPSQNGDVTMQKAGEHLLQKLESDLADTEGKIASIQSEIDGAKKAGQTGDAISKLESKKKWYQESADIQKDSVEKFRKQIEAHHSKPATEGISLEDAGMRAQKPAEIFNTVALSMKSQFLSGLPRPETLILFSPNYAAELEKLAREFARLKPIDALMKRYTAIDQWLGKAMGEAATIDAIKDINEYRPRLEDFRKSFEAEVNHIHETPDDAELLAGDITRFYASREDHGSNAFAIETPQTGDQLMHVARVTDTTFRAVRAVTAEIKDAGAELKRLENLFESLSTKINTASAGGTGNTGARDFVAHTLQSEVRLVSSKVRSIVQGLGVFTNYYSDAHRAVSRYQKFVIKVVEAALHEMKGDHEFQEEQIRSLLAKLRDANNAFDRIK